MPFLYLNYTGGKTYEKKYGYNSCRNYDVRNCCVFIE